MKKFSLFLILVLLALFSAAFIAWANRENIVAHFLSNQLHVPVSLNSLEIDKQGATLNRFWMGTPKNSRSSTSFSAEMSRIDTSLDNLFGNPLVIEKIDINHIFVGIESYDAQGTKTNWTVILDGENEHKSSRNYLIKTLILRDLTIEITQVDGTVKRYPTIAEMEFNNISNETGFPIDAIEKAIFNLMIKNIFKSLPNQIFKNLPIPSPGTPLPF